MRHHDGGYCSADSLPLLGVRTLENEVIGKAADPTQFSNREFAFFGWMTNSGNIAISTFRCYCRAWLIKRWSNELEIFLRLRAGLAHLVPFGSDSVARDVCFGFDFDRA